MNAHTTTIGPTELLGRSAPQAAVREELGYQPLLERDVIIKQLTPEAAADPRARGLFIKDARTLAALHHHNVVQVYEAGMHDDLPYVVIERLNGITVQQRLEQVADHNARMDVAEAVAIVDGVATAVEHAHRSATLVRDVSPANIVLSNDGRTVLASLGQPLPEDVQSAAKTALAYAAPEQLLGGTVDARSDVYGLGVLLFHLVFGELPFAGSAAGIIAKKQTSASLPALDDTSSEMPCPYALAHLIRQATNRTLEQRYGSVTAFRNALANVLSGGAVKLHLRQRPSYATYLRLQLRRRLHHADGSAPVEFAREFGGGVVVEAAPQHAAPAPATLAVVPRAPVFSFDTLDPLMPGRDEPRLHAALPFTTLVPLPSIPEAAQPEGPPDDAAPRSRMPSSYLLLLGLLMLAAAGVGVAMTLG